MAAITKWLRVTFVVIAAVFYVTVVLALLLVLFVGIPVACPGALTAAWGGVTTLLQWATECQRTHGQTFQLFANTAQIAGGLSILIALLSLVIEQQARVQERRRQEQRDQQLLRPLFDRVKIEVRDNQQAAAAMVRNLERESGGDLDRLEKLLLWAAGIASSLSSQSYADLRISGVGHLLPSRIEEALRSAHHDASSLRVQGEISVRSWNYFRGVSADECTAVFQNLLNRSRTVQDSLAHVKDEVFAHVTG